MCHDLLAISTSNLLSQRIFEKKSEQLIHLKKLYIKVIVTFLWLPYEQELITLAMSNYDKLYIT